MRRAAAIILWFAAALLPVALPAALPADGIRREGIVNTDAVEAFRKRPAPMFSYGREISVLAEQPERRPLVWPVLRFADGVCKHLSETFIPLGSGSSPVMILLGSDAKPNPNVRFRIHRIGSDFAQVLIIVPNPDTVDMEQLRRILGEALLREKARGNSWDFTRLTWPKWFTDGLIAASLGNRRRMENYETLLAERDAGNLPSLNDFFRPGFEPSPAAAAQFADWILFLKPAAPERLALLTAPWTRENIVGTANDADWPAYLTSMEQKVILPGAVSRATFRRWKTLLREPNDADDASAIAEQLTRASVLRPQIFVDLTAVWLRAYAAAARGRTADYQTRRKEAEELTALFEASFPPDGLIAEPPKDVPPSEPKK